MAQRSPSKQKQFVSRRWGGMKKFNEMYKLYGVKAATIIADEEDVYIYQSEENFPVELQNIRGQRFLPIDFITHRQYERERNASKTEEMVQTTKSDSMPELPLMQGLSPLHDFTNAGSPEHHSAFSDLVVSKPDHLTHNQPLVAHVTTPQPVRNAIPALNSMTPPHATPPLAKAKPQLKLTRSTKSDAPITRSATKAKNGISSLRSKKTKAKKADDPYNFGV